VFVVFATTLPILLAQFLTQRPVGGEPKARS